MVLRKGILITNGKIGGQIGNSNKADSKQIESVFKMINASKTGKDRRRKLYNVVGKIFDCALKGEQWACQMVVERIEGKVPQAIEMDSQIQVFIGGVPLQLPQGQTLEHETDTTTS